MELTLFYRAFPRRNVAKTRIFAAKTPETRVQTRRERARMRNRFAGAVLRRCIGGHERGVRDQLSGETGRAALSSASAQTLSYNLRLPGRALTSPVSC
jgi:hypothetical protein